MIGKKGRLPSHWVSDVDKKPSESNINAPKNTVWKIKHTNNQCVVPFLYIELTLMTVIRRVRPTDKLEIIKVWRKSQPAICPIDRFLFGHKKEGDPEHLF